MAETEAGGAGGAPDPEAGKTESGAAPSRRSAPVAVASGINPELERQAAAQLAADQERSKAAEKLAGQARKAGRPTTAELAAREDALLKAEQDFAQRQLDGQSAIEARRSKGKTAEGEAKDALGFDGPIGGIWCRFIGNPRARGEDDIGPQFEEMRGYSFELGGDWIFVKGDDLAISKFRGNDHFVTEAVSVEDAEAIPDGEVRERERDTPRRRVGKVKG